MSSSVTRQQNMSQKLEIWHMFFIDYNISIISNIYNHKNLENMY